MCRLIDRVTVKGSNKPIGLYTVDCCVEDIPHSLLKIKPIDAIKENMETKKQLINEIVENENSEIKTFDFFSMEKDFVAMLKEVYNFEF